MSNPLEMLQDLDFSDRKVQIAAAGVGGIFVYAVIKARHEAKTGASASTVESPEIPETFGTVRQPGGQPGVIGNVGSYPVPGPAGPAGPKGATGTTGPKGATGTAGKLGPVTPPKNGDCANGQIGLVRNGKTVCAALPSRPSITCSKGYIVVKDPGKPQRCAVFNDKRLGPGQKEVYTPKTTGGKAGEAISAMDSYHGRVGGIYPNFMPLTARRSYTVEDGDTPASVARKVYGGPEWLNKLVIKNGPLGDMRVGDVLDT